MYPKAYVDFLALFHGPRDYFECHEVLEDYWKQNTVEGRDSVWVGLIQVAVSLYHQRNNNFAGSARLLKKAIANLERKTEALIQLGIDQECFLFILKTRLEEINEEQPYYSINIPISDIHLLQASIFRCHQLGYEWQKQSDLSNEFLLRKHALRDCSKMIAKRAMLINKQKK